MKKRKSRENFWLVLGLINLLAIVYPITYYLQADGMEEQLVGVAVLVGVGLFLALLDTISIAVAYS